MDWVLNNLENVIIPIIIMILYGLGNVGQKKKKSGKQARGQQPPQTDPDEARRVREIQEEIRRKIAERTGRVPPPIPTREPETVKPVPQTQTQRFPTPSRTTTRRPEPPPVQPARTYQDELEEKMRQVRELEAQAAAKPAVSAGAYAIKKSPRKVAHDALRAQLLTDLSHPFGQRKAILVSEILGPPVGIKGPSGWKANV